MIEIERLRLRDIKIEIEREIAIEKLREKLRLRER